MASIINAATSGGLITTADTSGVLQLQTAGTTAISVSAAQVVDFANAPTVAGSSSTLLTNGGPLGTPSSGTLTNCTFPTLNQNTTGTATTATNLAGGSNGTVPYQTGSGATAMLAVGSSGQVLTSNGASAPSWTTISTSPPTTYGAIGTYVTGYVAFPSGTSISAGTTFTGSDISYPNPGSGYTIGLNLALGANPFYMQGNLSSPVSLGLSGTWRLMTYAQWPDAIYNPSWKISGLFLRVS